MPKWTCVIALFCALLVAPMALAQSEPADGNIKAALYDIEKAEQQIPSLTPKRKANIKRLQNSLALTEERLAASPNKEHPSWVEANDRLQAAKAALDQLAGGGTTATTGTTQPEAGEATVDPTLKRLQSELNMLAKQVSGLKEGDHGRATRQVSDALRIAQDLIAYPNREDPAWIEAVEVYRQINNHLVTVMAPSWRSYLIATAEYIGQMAPLDYMDGEKVGSMRQRLNGLYNEIQSFQNPNNPQIAELMEALVQLGTAFEQRVGQAEADLAALGDYSGQLQAVAERTRALKIPKGLIAPFSAAEVEAFVATIAAAEQQIAQDLAYLQSIEGKAPLTVEQRNDFREARTVLTHSKPGDIKQALDQTNFAIDSWVTEGARQLDRLSKADPRDGYAQANIFLGEGRFEENLARLAEGLEAVQVAAAYDAAISRAGGPDRAAQERQFQAAIAAFKDNHRIALDSKRMPPAQSEDPDLLAAAAEVLARPQYGFDHKRMVINYDIQRKERTEGEIDSGTVSSTITVTHYVWDEFQTTTAEKVGEDYYLFVNEFHFYHSADHTVPTGKWILHDRFQSSQIREENIDK